MKKTSFLVVCGCVCLPVLTLAGSLNVNGNAKFVGSYGLEVNLTDTTPAYVQDESPSADKRYRARFHVNLNQLSLGGADDFDLFVGCACTGSPCPGGSDVAQFRVILKRHSNPPSLEENRIVFAVREDGGGEQTTAAGNEVRVPDHWHGVEIDWKASDAGLSNGHLNVWLDGQPFVGLTGLDNDQGQIDYVKWGAVANIKATTSGQAHLDEFASRRDNYIGYLPGGPIYFYTLTPCRLLDTRLTDGPFGGPVLSSGNNRLFSLAERCGIPRWAQSISVNVTITGPTGGGFVATYPGDEQPSGTSSINFSAGQTRANNAVLQLSKDGNGTVGVQPVVLGSGQVHLILDVNGYYGPYQ